MRIKWNNTDKTSVAEVGNVFNSIKALVSDGFAMIQRDGSTIASTYGKSVKSGKAWAARRIKDLV